MFASGGRFSSGNDWVAKLIDENGKVRETRERMQVTQVDRDAVLLGAMPRNFGGLPIMPSVSENLRDFKPSVARIQLEQFPDNPIALEGLNSFYLNSEKALELRIPQITALLAWVRNGGHLILGVEQISDVTGSPWLSQFLPIELTSERNVQVRTAIQKWIKNEELDDNAAPSGGMQIRNSRNDAFFYENMSPDATFKDIEMVVGAGTIKDGRVLIANQNTPLAVQAPRGRGTLTVLMFSPEREPFRSWKTKGYFWAKLAQVPGTVFTSDAYMNGYSGVSIDGVFGALIDSRQIKKLPVEWLLLILVVYLLVIGPFDQWWLKKINRQMLSWITFPTYVVLISVLIYFIGYKLRAGETEWNELNIVDVLPRGDRADLRGRTYISIYSSGNATYSLAGQEGFSTLRPELMDISAGARESGKNNVLQVGNGYQAEVPVPVWSSLLYANDWFATNDMPMTATVSRAASGWTAEVKNLLSTPLKEIRIAVGNYMFELNTEIPAGESKTFKLDPASAKLLPSFVSQNYGYYKRATELRHNQLGETAAIDDRALTGAVISFIHSGDANQSNRRNEFVTPPGLELSPLIERGDAVIFGYLPNQSLTPPNNKFTPPRLRRDTLLRLSVPVKKQA
jgi:hypothetical protein